MGVGRWSVGRIQIILDATCLRAASFPDLLEFPVCDGAVQRREERGRQEQVRWAVRREGFG